MTGLLRLIALAAAIALTATAAGEPCRPDTVTGFFQGTAKWQEVGDVDVTLNLHCDKGEYGAHLFTSVGDIGVSKLASKGAIVTFAFDTGVSLGTFELKLAGDRLDGTFKAGGETGEAALVRKGPARAPEAMLSRIDLTPAEWREDLDALKVMLPKRHANAFFYLPKEKFEAEIARLRNDVANLNGDQIFVRITQIVNAIGDGHTGIVAPRDRASLPIELQSFGADMRVVAVGQGLTEANGAKVLKIGGADIAEARQRALTLTPSEELMELREGRIVRYLARGMMLHGLGLTPTRDVARFTLQSDAGRTFALDIPALKAGAEAKLEPAYPKTGLRYRRPDETFWCESVAAAKAVYCAWNAYQELEAKAAQMFALVESSGAEKLVIDLRENGGGDNTVGYAHVVKPLAAHAKLNRKGRLFILIGPLTFSAAMNNAAQLQDQTEAILVGQTIGEKPNSYQEPRQFRLPNSNLVVRASTLYYEFRKTGPNAIAPDKEIIPTWADLKAGRDPALDWALAQ